jgi:hypothetical protein
MMKISRLLLNALLQVKNCFLITGGTTIAVAPAYTGCFTSISGNLYNDPHCYRASGSFLFSESIKKYFSNSDHGIIHREAVVKNIFNKKITITHSTQINEHEK